MSSFTELLKQINETDPKNEETVSPSTFEDNIEFLPIADDIATQILLHRNAHFGGKFEFMIQYYQNEGVGCSLDFSLKDIEKLAHYQNQLQQDLALFKLSEQEHLEVKSITELYKGLRKLLSISQNEQSVPKLLADLILTEEIDPQEEIEQLIKNERTIPYLVEILKTEDFKNPLFPGYGKAPTHAAKCLGKMKAEKAIIPLFESMQLEDPIFHEEVVLTALTDIGKPAFEFLMNVLKNQPITQDNEKAAICLVHQGENEAFAKESLKLLQNFLCLNFPNLVVHLILGCLGLTEKEDIEKFLALKSQLPALFDPDFHYVSTRLKKRY